MPDKTIDDLAESIRQMKSEIRDLKGQIAINKLGNQTIYQAISEQIINKPIIRDAQNVGTLSATGGFNLDGGDLVIHTSGEIQVPTVVVTNPDAGVDQTLTASGAEGSETITFSNDVNVDTGHFISESVVIGDQTLSEDSELLITDPLTPGLRIRDSGDAAPNAICRIVFEDNTPNTLGSITVDGGGSSDLNIVSSIVNADININLNGTGNIVCNADAIRSNQDNTTDLGTAAVEYKDLFIDGTAHIDTLDVDVAAGFTGDVNFAGGSTYKVEADGDAFFKDLYVTSNILNTTGNMDIKTTGGYIHLEASAGQTMYIDCGNTFQFRDIDDANEILMAVDTNNRTFRIGAADGNDDVASSFFGDLTAQGIAHFGDGGTTDYANFAADGTLTLLGTARVTKNQWLPFNAIRAPGTSPATFKEWGISGVWEFSDGTDDTIVFNIQFPNDMDKSVAPSMCVGWSSGTFDVAEKATWQLEYLYTQLAEDTTAAAQATISVDSNVTSVADGLILAYFPAMAVPHANDVCIHCRVKRLGAGGNDNLTDTAELHGISLSYTSNKLGT